ncbi:MAG: hypothetical protein GF309_13385 [Candidatus Lokiarchaeota archaeon]|nr:hypothetical protein [Candidatus Lokiarchaeota archaeon]
MTGKTKSNLSHRGPVEKLDVPSGVTNNPIGKKKVSIEKPMPAFECPWTVSD